MARSLNKVWCDEKKGLCHITVTKPVLLTEKYPFHSSGVFARVARPVYNVLCFLSFLGVLVSVRMRVEVVFVQSDSVNLC